MKIDLLVLRKQNKYTQLDMANLTGVSVSTYNLIENGKRNGSKDFWLTIQQEFKLSDAEAWQIQK